ncbi:hypothetical protein PMM47T1_23092 [Pseudomonas sp. M47T1]|uniref:hypothetical protein n=1 Tax=Pseudomonas sp. M47T1 TaxID=1179778 RepID=UPI0002607349|nr:hypothetical protein [Pseudomonas sp. M47T1]EIK94150.1 hypothetical protein PMM47T1_23092 [Pseudomonas sp. M47T1]
MKAAQVFTFSAIFLAGVAALPAYAACTTPVDPDGVHLQEQQKNGITYLSGGYGEDESCAIQQVHGYNLRITFSAGTDNKYEAGVHTSIQNPQGHEVLTLDDAGPILLVKLPAGKYVVVSQVDGHEVRNAVNLGDGKMQSLNVHWREASSPGQ